MGDPFYASPIVANGRLYLRTWKALYTIAKKPDSTAGSD